jgi:hypothetical protein
MLGPARFAHIRTVTLQSLSRLSLALALPTLITRLTSLDAEIALLSPPSVPPFPTEAKLAKEKQKTQYAALDVPKAERLVAAREKRVELLRKKKEEKEGEEKREMEALHEAAEKAEREEREKREREDEADEEAAREAEGL